MTYSYGGGFSLSTQAMSLINHLAGYYGYLNIGDRPMVLSSELRINRKIMDWSVSYLWGINDFSYQRYRISMIFHIPSSKLFKDTKK